MVITREAEMVLLAAGSYWDIRRFPDNDQEERDTSNQAPIPEGWSIVSFDESGSGKEVSSWSSSGFSARAYQKGNEIVISYSGTETGENGGFNSGSRSDFAHGNIPLAVGMYAEQAYQAALFYEKIKENCPGKQITFTGHSLGGGLAGLMGVWFDKPAYVFAPAPFELSAKSHILLKNLLMEYLLDQERPIPTVLDAVRKKLGNSADEAFKSYNPDEHFLSREKNVQAWAIKGEALEMLDKGLLAISVLSGTYGLISGSLTAAHISFLAAQVNPIERGRKHLFTEIGDALGAIDKHLIDLHAAALLVPNFEKQANKTPVALTLMFDNKLYGHAITSKRQNLLVKLIRNEVGIRANNGKELQAPNGMLTAFALDLEKLGGNAQSLSETAQKAIIAQGIQWYYWQGNDYAGQKFFADSSNAVLQYTTAFGDKLLETEDSNAFAYVAKWLAPIVNRHGEFYNYGFSSQYAQWSVVVSNAGGTAQAKDADKTQMMVGAAGSDVLTGGKQKDIIFAGAGDDVLEGGEGNDSLYGGEGVDTYQFRGNFGRDTILDTDGQGRIVVDGITLQGGNKKVGEGRWEDSQQGFTYSLAGSGFNTLLTIRRTTGEGQIFVRGWKDGNLGLSMSDTPQPPQTVNRAFYDLSIAPSRAEYAQIKPSQAGNLHIVNAIDLAQGGVVSGYAKDDLLVGGTEDTSRHAVILASGAGNDVIWSGRQKDSIQQAIEDGEKEAATGRSNVWIEGYHDDDQVIGGAGNEVLFGGRGHDTLVGGAGNDIIIADGEGVGSSILNTTSDFAWSVSNNPDQAPSLQVRVQVATADTIADSTGRKLRRVDVVNAVVSPLANTDLSGLLSMQASNVTSNGSASTYSDLYVGQ